MHLLKFSQYYQDHPFMKFINHFNFIVYHPNHFAVILPLSLHQFFSKFPHQSINLLAFILIIIIDQVLTWLLKMLLKMSIMYSSFQGLNLVKCYLHLLDMFVEVFIIL